MIAPTEQQTPTDIDPGARDEAARQQNLVPLFVLATAVMGVGFFFALRPGDAASKVGKADFKPASLTLTPPLDVRTDVAPQVLTYRPEAKPSHTYVLEQRSSRAQRAVTTQMSVTLDMAPKKEGGWDVALSGAALRVQGPDGVLGPGIGQQLQTVLDKSRAHLEMRPNGRMKSWRWTSRTNPQVRQTLRLVQDAVSLLTPRFEARAVAPGESWSYVVDLGGAKGAKGLSLEGGLKVDVTLLGQTTLKDRQVLVLSHKLSLTESGKFGDVGHEASGQGQGLVYFDPMLGHVVRHDLSLDVTLTASGQAQKMSYALSLR